MSRSFGWFRRTECPAPTRVCGEPLLRLDSGQWSWSCTSHLWKWEERACSAHRICSCRRQRIECAAGSWKCTHALRRPFDTALTSKVALGVHFKSHLQKDVEMIRRVTPWAPSSFVDVLFTYKRATNYPKLSGPEQPYILLIDSVGQKFRQETAWGGGGCLCSMKSGVQREDSRTGGGWQLGTRIIWSLHPSQAWWLLRPYLLGLLAGTSTHSFSSWSGQSLHTVAGFEAEQPKIPGGSSPAFVNPPFKVDNTVVFLQGSIH